MTRFLNTVYDARDAASTRSLYDDWSATYEAEVAENGYATPGRCAAALADVVKDKSTPILDFGCGTGLSGLALRNVGFDTIDGVDLSGDMLGQAERKGTYRTLRQIEATDPIPEGYAVYAAIGVIGAGAAPVEVLHNILRALPHEGHFVFSFNDHALEDPINEGAVAEWTDTGAATLVFKEYGAHLPGINLKSNVYILEKN